MQNNIKNIDIVLLDMMMPELNGLEFLNIVKKNEKLKHVPIIIQSGANHQEIEKALSYGALKCIRKPFNKNELLQCLDEL
ncbi:MAG: response regulator [Sphingobacteriia bacterium]|nr:response regulator [Sphingobacteriia bacterium]